MQPKKDQNRTRPDQLGLLRLQTIKAIVESCSFKSLKSDEPRRVRSWTCIFLLGLRAKVQVERLSIKD